MSQNNSQGKRDSTLAALLREKPKRGRPPRQVSRQNVYVALTKTQRQEIKMLAQLLPDTLSRADLPDMAVNLLSIRMEALRRAVSGRNREIPEGITDLDSMRLLWDLPLHEEEEARWTSIRLSPQEVISLGRVHGTLNALFGATRSEVFDLALSLLIQFLNGEMAGKTYHTLEEMNGWMNRIYL
ncbi:MAG: hypothetical protein WAM60_07975 [Candidatus Promineifilaceae bacterium]